MVITFYTSTANPKQANKANFLTQIGTTKILNPTRALALLTPVVSVVYNANFVRANYCYIGAPFNSFYFCKCAVDVAGKIIVECQADSVYTWYNYLINCPATIIRNENIGINYVVDNKLPIDQNRFFIQGTEFPENPIEYDTENNKQYLLIINGGAS